MTRRCAICAAELSPENQTACCAECRYLARADWFIAEVWLPIIGFKGWEICDRGRIRDAQTGEIHEPHRSHRYPRTTLNGRRRYIHHLMGESWLGPRPFGALVLHADDRPDNMRVSNISYGTPADNAADRRRNHKPPAPPSRPRKGQQP